MRLSSLLDYMRTRLEKRRATVKPPTSGMTDKEFYSSHQAQMTLGLIEEVITQLETYIIKPLKNGDPVIDPQIDANHVKIITKFFEFRWQLIKNTDEYYFIRTNCQVNLLCKDIAQFLATNDFFVGSKHTYELLMPTVIDWFNPQSNHQLEHYFWHKLLLTDEASDGTHRVIEMGYVLPPEINDRGQLRLSYLFDGKECQLSPGETVRVCHQSQSSYKIYEDFARRKVKNANSMPNQELEDAWGRELHNENYGGKQVTSSYGEKGLELLKRNLLQNVNRMFITREQLFDYLSSRVQPDKWGEFLAKLDSEIFFNLMVGKENLMPAQQNASKLVKLDNTITHSGEACLKAKDANSDAALYCFLCAYWQMRDEDKKAHTGPLGRLGGWERSSKQAAVEEMKKLLTNQEPFNTIASQQAYLDPKVEGARNEGTLGKIFKLMCKFKCKHENQMESSKPTMAAK